MILNFRKDQNISIDAKIQSLMESVQLALNEKADNKALEDVKAELARISKELERRQAP